jgi:hypothetical protein
MRDSFSWGLGPCSGTRARSEPVAGAGDDLMILYGIRSPGPGSEIVGDVVEWFATRAEAERFIAEVAAEPNPEDAMLANRLSVVEVDFELVQN